MASKAENRVKIMLVGEENVGKTSLLRALKAHLQSSSKKRKQTISSLGNFGRATTALLAFGGNSKKSANEEETQVTGDTLSTDGIDLTVEPLPISEVAMALTSSKERPKLKVPLSFSVWDFGGQEVYHTTHSFFLTERSIYLVVFRADREDKDSKVSYWLNAIKCHAPNAPIIIVATHLDKYVDPKGAKKPKSREVEETIGTPIIEKYQKKFPRLERSIRAVSTMTLKGLDELVRHLHEVAIKQPYAQDCPPEKWFDLECIFMDKAKHDRQDNMPPILTWDETFNISKMAMFPTNDNHVELTKATDFLHEAGSIYKHIYTDEATGSVIRTIIVDPQWIARVFSTVLTTKHAFLKTGIMTEQQLFEQLWREYPKSIHPVLLDLFLQFNLFYRVTDANGKPTGEILVPATLPIAKPVDVQPMLPGKETSLYQFERRYTFEFVPSALLSRYLVKAMTIGEPLRYWRQGCLIKHKKQNAFALIELKAQLNTLTIILRSDSDATKFFCQLVELFEFFTGNFFKLDHMVTQYLDPITGAQFTLEQIEEASAKGESSIANKDGIMISVDRVAPDLALSTFQSLQIDIENDVVLGETLGEGAFAQVVAGTYKNEPVAVKRLLRCQTKEQQRRLFSEFRREVLTMTNMAHLNIVNLKGFSNQPPFSMVMELVPNGTLYDFLAKPGQISWPLRIRIAYDIALAMAFLHSAEPPLIHKDLKSPNILLAGTKHDDLVVAKVADFGISGKLYSSTFKATTAKERQVENPTWLAPEVIKEEPYTAAADVYPYGIILWELAARAHPFDEYKTEFPSDLEALIVAGKRPTIPSDCPPAFEALIQDCWHANPQQRPSFAKIVSRFTTIISEISPSLLPLTSKIRREQADFHKKAEILKKERDAERQDKWRHMREEEKLREAEKKRLAAAALAASSSSVSTSSNNISASDEDSLEESADASNSEELKSSTDSKPNSDVPVKKIVPSGSSGSLPFELGTVYQRLNESDLRDLWIQRGIPLQDGVSKQRLIEVLDNDDQWLFNQRKLLLSLPGQSPKITPVRTSVTTTPTPIPFQVSLPCLYVTSPFLTPTEIQERNDLIGKQEKALGDFLKTQETQRMELHNKHSKLIDTRAKQTAAANSASNNNSNSNSGNSAHSNNVSPATSVSATGTNQPSSSNTSNNAPAQEKTNSTAPSVSSLKVAFGGAPPSSANSPTTAGVSPTTAKSSPKAVSSVSGQGATSNTVNAARVVPPRPVSGVQTYSQAQNSLNNPTPSSSTSTSSGSAPSSLTLSTHAAATVVPPSTSPHVAPPPINTATVSTTAASNSTPPTSATAIAPSSSAPTSALASSNSHTIRGSWSVSANTAGGSPNTPHWRRNPQFTLVIGPGPVTLTLTMTQPNAKEPIPFIAFYIFKSEYSRRVLDMKEKIFAPEHFINKTSIDAKCTFPEGAFSIMCASFQKEDGDFELNVAGPGIVSLSPVAEWIQKSVSGAWAKGSCGGCMNHPSWKSNPKFNVKVSEGTGKAKIIATLIAQAEIGSGFYVFNMSNLNVPISKSSFTTISVVHEMNLNAGEYIFMPTTYDANKEANFEMTFYSDRSIEVSAT